MATPIEMPQLSDTMTEGTLVKWHKSEGDTISIILASPLEKIQPTDVIEWVKGIS